MDAGAPTPRRPSTTRDRPSRTPFGPRIRTKTKHSADTADTPTSPTSTSAPDSPQDAELSIDASLASAPSHADAAIQAPSSPTKPAPAPPKPAPTTFVAPPPLTPPPTISFESTPIPWKGLPFEAAQWTFSSSELQDIVSKAIRLSARESFVRLLSLQALEVDIVHEAERLESERAAAQAKWRFEVGRRTMLMHALNSTVASSVLSGNDDNAQLVTGFIAQLATSIASCDTLLSSILHCFNQESQIAVVEQQHWASALGVALRKLNKAYERQGQELKRTQARVQTLEDELEEAWREAEKMAIEFDELEQEVAESEHESEGVEEDTELGVVQDVSETDTGLRVKQDGDETGTLDGTMHTDIAVVLGVTATAVASKATLVSSPGSPRLTDKSDTKSIRSVKSTRSRRSTGPSHASRVTAARTRSRAASNASLRLPKALRSAAATHSSATDAPPMPARPRPHIPGRSFLDMGIRERLRRGFPPPRQLEPPQSALPTPPNSAGPESTRVPSIWVETDGGKSTRLNGLDRTHSLQIFSSLAGRTLKKTRRSNLVMSLTGSDRGSDSATGSPIDGHGGTTSASGSSIGLGMGVVPSVSNGTGECNTISNGTGTITTTTTTGSPLSSSPVSLPTHLTHLHSRGPSVSSSNASLVGVGASARPGSAGARLTTTPTTSHARTPMSIPPPGTPSRRSLMSRAGSVIMRRLSQATLGSARTGSSGDRLSPSRSREALRLSGSGHVLADRWMEQDEEGEGEVMLIGSPIAESLDDP